MDVCTMPLSYMKKKIGSILAISLCGAMLLAGCSSTDDDTAATAGQSKNGNETVEVEDQENTASNKGNIILDINEGNEFKSLEKGLDSYNKVFKDDSDEYNSKASPAEDFLFKESALNPGTYMAIYKGESNTVVVPSRVDGVIVGELAEIKECVENLTIPDTVEILTCSKDCGNLKEITYSGTAIRSEASLFRESPYREANTKDGTFIFGNALISYKGETEEYHVPEGVVAIAEDAFSGSTAAAKSIILPSTLKYIDLLEFKKTESITVNSEIDMIFRTGDIEGATYINKIYEGIYSFGNVLVKCAPDDRELDIVIPDNINRIGNHCFYGKAKSIRFESEEDVKFNCTPFFDGAQTFFVDEFVFPKNTTNLLIKADSHSMNDVSNLVLPEKVKYLNGELIDRCRSSLAPLPDSIEFYTTYNDNPPQDEYPYVVSGVTDLKSQGYIDQILQNGGTVILIARH